MKKYHQKTFMDKFHSVNFQHEMFDKTYDKMFKSDIICVKWESGKMAAADVLLHCCR